MAIVDPDSLAANVNAFAERFERNGRCDSCYTQGKDYKVGQGGDEADCVIADAFAKNISGIDWCRIVPLLESRWGGRTRDYRERGFAVNGGGEDYCRRFKSGSATMSFAYQDWCCAEVLSGLGKSELAARFRERSGNWTNVWDDSAIDAPSGMHGFAHARLADGSFTKTDPRKGFNTDFYEANCWEYSMFVPHDMAALVVRCGGKDAFRDRLSYALENGLVDFGNEPGFLVPWLFAYVGRGDLAAKGAREVAKLFAGDDLPGDNDSGAMSALYVFLKLGFFPVAGQDIYIMHGSAYPRIEIELAGGKTFVIRTTGSGDAIKSVTLNGHPHDPLFLRHSEIASGGELVFVKGSKGAAY
jgi:putative alpha-1,2-mannosidase